MDAGALRAAQRSDARDFRFDISISVPEIDGALGVEPKLGRVSEQPAEPERHFGAHRPAASEKLVDRLTRHSCRLCEASDAEVVIGHEVLPQHHTRMSGAPQLSIGVADAHRCVSISVIVADLNVERVAIYETKADSPLIVHGDGVLSYAVALECVKPVAPWHSQILEGCCQVNVVEPANRSCDELGRKSPRLAPREQVAGPPVGERFNHLECNV